MESRDNLYWDSNMHDNMEFGEPRDSTFANPDDSLYELAYKDPLTREVKFGTMPKNQDLRIKIAPGEKYTIPLGYHSGKSTIAAQDLSSSTQGTATAADIAKNKVAWVNGIKLIGELDVFENDGAATATENDILLGKTAWVNRILVTGKIQSIFPGNVSLFAGQSYTIQKGYYENSVITTRSLADQTVGSATAADITKGKLAWVNGVQLLGSAKTLLENLSDATVTASDIRAGKIGYGASGKVYGGMDEYVNQPLKTLAAGTSFTIPKGYTDGLWSVQAASLASQTVSTATAADIRKDKTAWVAGQLLTGTLIQNFAPNTEATAKPDDIFLGKTAWVNGEKLIGTNPYDTIDFEYFNDNDESPETSLVIMIPSHNWNSIRSLRVDIISTIDNSVLHLFKYRNVKAGSTIQEKESGEPIVNIVTMFGSPKVIITSFIPDSFMRISAYGYTLSN